MSNPNDISRGNIQGEWVLSITLSPASVAPNTTSEQTFAVQGLLLGDFTDISKPTTQGGLGISNTRVSAAGVLAIAFANLTAATITPTSAELYELNVARPSNLNPAGNGALLTGIT